MGNPHPPGIQSSPQTVYIKVKPGQKKNKLKKAQSIKYVQW